MIEVLAYWVVPVIVPFGVIISIIAYNIYQWSKYGR